MCRLHFDFPEFPGWSVMDTPHFRFLLHSHPFDHTPPNTYSTTLTTRKNLSDGASGTTGSNPGTTGLPIRFQSPGPASGAVIE